MNEPDKMKEVTEEELFLALDRAKERLPKEDYELFLSMADTLVYLKDKAGDYKIQMRSLIKRLLGFQTEKFEDELYLEENNSLNENQDSKELNNNELLETENNLEKKKKPRSRGGRYSSVDFPSATTIEHKVEGMEKGQICPSCAKNGSKGKMYLREPKSLLRIKAQSPIVAELHKLETWRCRICDYTAQATPAEDIGDKRFDDSVGVLCATTRFELGLPTYRLEQYLKRQNTPLPQGTQYQLIRNILGLVTPIYYRLVLLASQADHFLIDDTRNKILNYVPEIEGSNRKQIYTTIIRARGPDKDDKEIISYITSHRYARENLYELLKNRSNNLATPLVMSDCSSMANINSEAKKIKGKKYLEELAVRAGCLAHARRKFHYLLDSFPDYCKPILKLFSKIYELERKLKEQNYDKHQRLLIHQVRSSSDMLKIREICTVAINEKKVEPNSSLGQAMSYFTKNYEAFRTFLIDKRSPLDNNLAEQGLKLPIRHRKNSLFYKTKEGAFTGDVFTSIIQTCIANKVNAQHYLISLTKSSELVKKQPELFLPWNYLENLPKEEIY